MHLAYQSIIKSVTHSVIYSFSQLDIYFSSHSVSQLRNGPDKNDSNNGNEHVGMQKRC